LKGGCIIGLQQVSHRELLCIEINERLPGQGILQVTPEPLNRIQLWAIGRQPHSPQMVGPPQAPRGVGATVVQEQDVQAVRKGLGEGVHEEHVGLQIGEFQEEALVRRWGHGARDIEPFEGVLDRADGLDPLGRESPAAHRQ
jgi:hypothetical protein